MHDVTSNGIATRIREAREGAGMRAEALAAVTDLSLGTIRNYEAGRTQPSVENLRRIAAATRVELLWLLGEEVHA